MSTIQRIPFPGPQSPVQIPVDQRAANRIADLQRVASLGARAVGTAVRRDLQEQQQDNQEARAALRVTLSEQALQAAELYEDGVEKEEEVSRLQDEVRRLDQEYDTAEKIAMFTADAALAAMPPRERAVFLKQNPALLKPVKMMQLAQATGIDYAHTPEIQEELRGVILEANPHVQNLEHVDPGSISIPTDRIYEWAEAKAQEFGNIYVSAGFTAEVLRSVERFAVQQGQAKLRSEQVMAESRLRRRVEQTLGRAISTIEDANPDMIGVEGSLLNMSIRTLPATLQSILNWGQAEAREISFDLAEKEMTKPQLARMVARMVSDLPLEKVEAIASVLQNDPGWKRAFRGHLMGAEDADLDPILKAKRAEAARLQSSAESQIETRTNNRIKLIEASDVVDKRTLYLMLRHELMRAASDGRIDPNGSTYDTLMTNIDLAVGRNDDHINYANELHRRLRSRTVTAEEYAMQIPGESVDAFYRDRIEAGATIEEAIGTMLRLTPHIGPKAIDDIQKLVDGDQKDRPMAARAIAMIGEYNPDAVAKIYSGIDAQSRQLVKDMAAIVNDYAYPAAHALDIEARQALLDANAPEYFNAAPDAEGEGFYLNPASVQADQFIPLVHKQAASALGVKTGWFKKLINMSWNLSAFGVLPEPFGPTAVPEEIADEWRRLFNEEYVKVRSAHTTGGRTPENLKRWQDAAIRAAGERLSDTYFIVENEDRAYTIDARKFGLGPKGSPMRDSFRRAATAIEAVNNANLVLDQDVTIGSHRYLLLIDPEAGDEPLSNSVRGVVEWNAAEGVGQFVPVKDAEVRREVVKRAAGAPHPEAFNPYIGLGPTEQERADVLAERQRRSITALMTHPETIDDTDVLSPRGEVTVRDLPIVSERAEEVEARIEALATAMYMKAMNEPPPVIFSTTSEAQMHRRDIWRYFLEMASRRAGYDGYEHGDINLFVEPDEIPEAEGATWEEYQASLEEAKQKELRQKRRLLQERAGFAIGH